MHDIFVLSPALRDILFYLYGTMVYLCWKCR